jgi:hypothetical protein
MFDCYQCDIFQINIKEEDYEAHVVFKHSDKPSYPCKADFGRLGLKEKYFPESL